MGAEAQGQFPAYYPNRKQRRAYIRKAATHADRQSPILPMLVPGIGGKPKRKRSRR